MSEESKETAEQTEVAAEMTEEEQTPSIAIELDELTEEGKKKAEESLKRAIEDIAYEVTAPEALPGSVMGLKFTLAKAEYEAEQTRLLRDLQKEVTLPGFRKGKAPVKLLQIRLGEDAVRDTVRSVATNALRQENAKQELKFIAKPQIVGYDLPSDGDKVTFEIECEVEPTVELKNFSGFKVEVEDRPVTDEMIDQHIDGLRRQNAVVESAADDAVLGEEDMAMVDVEVISEKGERINSLCKEGQMLYSYKQELPEAIAGQLAGKKVGDVVEGKVPSTKTNRRGDEVTYDDAWTVTLKGIKINKLPALDDEFAKDLGECDSLADLREKTRTELTDQENERQNQEAVAKLGEMIVENNPVDAPRSMISSQEYNLIMQDSYQLSRMGLKLDQVVSDPDKYMADQKKAAEGQVKMNLLMSELAKTEKLEVTDEDIDKEIAEMAEKTGRKPLAVRARLEAQKQLDQLRETCSRKKIEAFLLEKNELVKVAPKPAEEAEGEAEAEDKPKKKAAPKKKTEE